MEHINWQEHHGNAPGHTTKATHTPGPWSITPPREDQLTRYCRWQCDVHVGEGARQGNLIARVHMGGDGAIRNTAEAVEANAKLIAAAPELLEALRELLAAESILMPPFEAGKAAQDAWASRSATARENARAAIAKATES